MFNKLHSVLASRLASIMLTAVLFAALTAPFVMLQSMHAFAAPPPLPCTEGNNNGCTELSATPPEDLQPVPPNIVLMLDDSGSMAWDFMPDWAYLTDNGIYGTRNSGINAVYYDPSRTYTPPPKATATGTSWESDGTWYPNSPGMTGAYTDGFAPPAATSIVNGSGYVGGGNGNTFNYTDNLATTLFNTTPATPPVDKGKAVWGGGTSASPGGCLSGYFVDPGDPTQCIRNPVSPTHVWTCNSGDGSAYNSGGVMMCHHKVWEEGVLVDHPYNATDGGLTCPSGSTGPQSDGKCHYAPTAYIPPTSGTPNYKWTCPSGGTFSGSPPGPPKPAPECWTSGTSGTSTRIYVRAFTYVVGTPVSTNSHYVIPNVTFNSQDPPAGGWCSVLYYAWQKTNCTDGNVAGKASPAGVTADQNVANWFSYYRTRMLMTKTGLMNAFLNVDAKYRFGFGSINGNGKTKITGPAYTPSGTWSDPGASMPYVSFDDSYSNSDGTGGDASNRLATVQPYGLGTDPNSQKAKFWTWLANESPAKGTPLRKALSAAGEYYKTAQPWQTMTNDPGYTSGSTTPFTCRAAFTILTTDGFWNGDPPTVADMANAANVDGTLNTVPAGRTVTHYTAVDPYQGGAIAGGAEPSLADVATYYWENDLNTSLGNEVAITTSDPASWQHMTTYTIGLGVNPVGITPAGTTVSQIFGWANGGAAIAGFAWPVPASDTINNIADLAHAAVNGHGDFFNVNNPADLADAFSKISADAAARSTGPTPTAVNASVLSVGAASFRTGYTTGVWTSTFDQVTL
ncbi:MAG TPA: hypothetical protein VGN24_09300, partial [Rhodanobacter sp.]|nr:hypothetical protein [Rhodanobacter sp.]